MLSRSARIGIAAMSALANGGLTTAEIARRRDINPAYLAKILTVLSRNRLIRGIRGPGGGYILARAPGRIALLDIVGCFERVERTTRCPLGGGKPCSSKHPCALHYAFHEIWNAQASFLAGTTLDVFVSSK